MWKSFVILIVYLSLSINSFALAGFVVNANSLSSETNDYIRLDSKIHKEVKDAISDVYGKENSDEIYRKFLKYADKAIKSRPKDLVLQDKNRDPQWYKDEIIYMFYVDQFGIVKDDKSNTFSDTVAMLDYLKDLGVTTLYMLPFAESPMNDAGFDVIFVKILAE